jgi:hypothetical protein
MLVNWYYINLFLVFVGTGSQANRLNLRLSVGPLSLTTWPVVYIRPQEILSNASYLTLLVLDRDLSSCSVYQGAWRDVIHQRGWPTNEKRIRERLKECDIEACADSSRPSPREARGWCRRNSSVEIGSTSHPLALRCIASQACPYFLFPSSPVPSVSSCCARSRYRTSRWCI